MAELGWSHKEELLEIIYTDGRVQVMSDNLTDFTELSFFDHNGGDDEIVLEAKFLDDESITILTSENNFISFDLFNMTKFKYVQPEFLEFNSPQSWCPTTDESVVFAINTSLYKIKSNDEMIQKQIGYGTICHLDIDHNSNDLLVLTSDYRILVINSIDFTVKFDVNVNEEIDVFSINRILWLTDSKTNIAVLSSSSTGNIALVDLNEGNILHECFSKSFLVSKESDGVRIVQNGRNSLITLMPSIMNDLTAENSKISTFFEFYVKKDFESIQSMTSLQLSEIIDLSSKSLLLLCYEQKLQENYAASIKFAVKVLEEKLGSDDNSKHTFSYITANINRSLTKCIVLKKLHENGMAVSPQELLGDLSDGKIIVRLCRSNSHGLAFEVGVLLESEIWMVLMDWTKKAIENLNIDEKELWTIISDKIFTWGNYHVDFIQLAEVAIKNKKFKLAVKLLKLEKDTRRKIELLVQLNEYREAVIESVQSQKQDQSKKKLKLEDHFNY